MGYIDPETVHNPATNTIAPAAWGDAIDAAVQWVADLHARAKVYHSTTNTLGTSGTAATLAFDSEVRDVGGMHSTVTNNSRLTVPAGASGDYDISAVVEFTANATGYREVFIRKNGSTVLARSRVPATATLTTVVPCVAPVTSLVAGDYVEVLAVQLSGGSLTVVGGSTATLFTMRWVAT